MKIVNNKIIIDNRDINNKFVKLKKYLNKDITITPIECDEINTMFIKCFNESNIKNRYEMIYDFMCNYLDKNVCLLCDFKCDKCKGNRLGVSVHPINGCCYLGEELCKHFINKHCNEPNISCKLFMCDTIEKEMGYKSITKNYLLLSYFFNKDQQELLQRSYGMSKKDLINKLLDIN